MEYLEDKAWREANPELDDLMNRLIFYDTLLIFVLIIGVFEILTKPSWLKKTTRILLISIVFGYQISKFIPIKDLNIAIYNTAWLSATIAFILIIVKIIQSIRNRNQRSNQ